MIATQSKYMVVGNGRIPTLESLPDIPDAKVDYISVILPEWFRTYNGKRIIKIYGTQLYNLESPVGAIDYTFNTEIPLEATLHCNIARESNTGCLVEPFVGVPEKEPDKGDH
jgi:hypothetical protein